MQHLKNLVEAALFIAAKPLTLEELKKVKGIDIIPDEELLSALKSMEADYDSHGIKVAEDSGRFELRIKDEFIKHVEHLAPNKDFSRATLQTLSLIAYKSPVKQSEIIEIRGNRAYDHIKDLLERAFIKSEASGHTNILSITQKFLDYFSLKSHEEVKAYFAKKIEKDEKKAMKKNDPVQPDKEENEPNPSSEEKNEPDEENKNKEMEEMKNKNKEENSKSLKKPDEHQPEEHMVEEFNKCVAE